MFGRACVTSHNSTWDQSRRIGCPSDHSAPTGAAHRLRSHAADRTGRVRAATGPQRCGPAAPASHRGRSRPHRNRRVLRPPRDQRAYPAGAPPVPDRARPRNQGRRPWRQPRRHLGLRRTRQLRRGIEENLRTRDVASVQVVNLRLMRASRPDALFDDQLAAMTAAGDNGLIGAVGLSNVTLPHLLHALKFTEIACVQNAYHPADRSSQPVLEESTRRGIAVPAVLKGKSQALTTPSRRHTPTERMRRVPARTGPESHGSVINPVMPSTRRDDFAPGHHRGANCAESTPARSAPAPTGGVTDPLRSFQTASAAVLTLVARGRQITTSPRDRGAKRWLAVVDPLLGPQGDARLHRIMTLHLVWLWV